MDVILSFKIISVKSEKLLNNLKVNLLWSHEKIESLSYFYLKTRFFHLLLKIY
jgi:hypothetical protein